MNVTILVVLSLAAVVSSKALELEPAPSGQDELELLTPILQETKKLRAMFERYKRVSYTILARSFIFRLSSSSLVS